MATGKNKKPPLTKPIVVAWPREVLVKNNTSFRFLETVKRVALPAHSEKTVLVSESELMRIKHNFMQLNLLNNWDNGLEVVDSMGDENGDV